MGQTGLYVHVPFCRQICPYCDFAVAVRRDPPHEEYCDALLRELESRRDELGAIRTVYFGGGTPAMWSTAALGRFMAALGEIHPEETTIEANPHDITVERLDTWASFGIDRVSLGVQSFDDDALQALGRDHDADRAETAARTLVEHGAFRTSIDLIYSGPRYDGRVARRDARTAAEIGVDHVSAYELTVESGTVFGRKSREGTLGLAPDERREDWGFEMVAELTAAGFDRYEVSSFGRAGDHGVHNSGYWLGFDYVGLGTGAHSFRGTPDGKAVRRANPRGLKAYMEGGAAEEEVVPAPDHLAERLFLAGRTTLGVAWADLEDRFGSVDAQIWGRVGRTTQEMTDLGWLAPGHERLSATHSGLDFGDDIAHRFWEATHSA